MSLQILDDLNITDPIYLNEITEKNVADTVAKDHNINLLQILRGTYEISNISNLMFNSKALQQEQIIKQIITNLFCNLFTKYEFEKNVDLAFKKGKEDVLKNVYVPFSTKNLYETNYERLEKEFKSNQNKITKIRAEISELKKKL
uniref:Uncharacterized protein orf144a n=1 Tax=Staurastrum punctulatum TaxID=102822 RepID=Q32RZ4_STAPU|nr:hypothetical protein StpuCp018 [Staurastrum punctulatum]AAX45783.1 hypothetical protein [Staurastrum punctulatum]